VAGTDEDRDQRELRFHRLYQEYFRPVQAYTVNRLGPVDEVADVVAEVFMTAWRRLPDIPPPPVIVSGSTGRPGGSSPGGTAAPAAGTTCSAATRPGSAKPSSANRSSRWHGRRIRRASACSRRSPS